MKKMIALVLTVALVMAVCPTAVKAETVNKAKMYPVTITFDPKDYPNATISSIQLMGEFLFYTSNLTGHTDKTGMNDVQTKYIPSQYTTDMVSVGGFYYQEMTYDEVNKVYTTSMQLPAGRYNYHFQINATWGEPVAASAPTSFANSLTIDGTKHGIESFATFGDWVVDPKNKPNVTSPTGSQRNSILEVGTSQDFPWIANSNVTKRGTVTYVPYEDVNKTTQYLGVYLPVGYNKNSSKPYKIVFASHGGGGNEGDWFHQGGINNIMDNLIADGKTSDAIVVTINNGIYPSEKYRWDFAKILDNLLNHVIPYMEKNYNVSTNVEDRAFCGLSMGGMTTSYVYMHAAAKFGYFGNFSGSLAGGDLFDLSSQDLKKTVLMVGSGEEDMAYNTTEIGTATFEQKLKENNIDHISYYVTGAHDWFTWPELYTYFAQEVLWHKASPTISTVNHTTNAPATTINTTVVEKVHQVYVVKPGDVLWKIAQKYNMTYKVLGDYNHLKNYHTIYPGQTLLIP